MKYINFIILVFLVSGVYSCAVQQSPLGGPKDEDPPVLDSLKSTQNYQTQFNDDEINLYFDEFVQLKNVFEQVVYSPPLRKKPEIKQRGKKVTMKFSELDTLKTNTTYTINFGDAIQDFNESNILANFRYVFSTGDIIDSLSIFGNIIADETQEPAEETLVLLYDNLSDSIVYKEQPYYFAKTDESGNFRIENLRSDTFKVFILKDGNLNLKYDEGETMGFLDTFIFVNDSLPGKLDLHAFEPVKRLRLRDEESEAYKFKFIFSRRPFDAIIKSASDSIWWNEEIRKDSLILWHDNTITNDTLYVYADSIILDTISFSRIPPKSGELVPLKHRRKNISRSNLLPPGLPLIYEYSTPISSIDTSKIKLKDSLQIFDYEIKIDSSNHKNLIIDYKYSFGDSLTLRIEPGGLKFINGNVNDTLKQLIVPESPEKYGILDIQIDSLDSSLQYVFQLFDGELLVKEQLIMGTESELISFINMPPKEYNAKIVEDANLNGKWDPGNYAIKRQSERWQKFSFEELRENWELKANLNWIK